MTDTLGKIVARVSAATASTSNPFSDERALTSGTGHIYVVSDLNHLMNTSATGPVFTHPGMTGFYRGVNGTGVGNRPSDVMWTPPGVDPGAFNLRVQFRVDLYDPATLPIVRLRCWMQAPPSGIETAYVVLQVGGFEPNDDSPYASGSTTNTSGEDITVEVQPRAEDLFPINTPVTLGYTSTGIPPLAEPHAETVITAWVGFVNTSNKNSDTANVYGISLSLEIPP